MNVSFYRLWPLGLLTALLSGCLVYDTGGFENDPYTKVEETYADITAQDKAEKAVEDYIRKTDPNGTNYKSYNFGQLYRLPAPEIKQLEELQASRELLPTMKDNYGNKLDSVTRVYDTLIAQKQREIKTRNIRSRLIISHLYTVKFGKDPGGNVIEAEFILDADFNVLDFRSQMNAKLGDDDFDWFFYFFRQTKLVNTGDNDADVAESDKLYDYYNARLATLTSSKEEFLKTALRVTRCVHRYNGVDKNRIAAYILMKYIQDYNLYPNYHPVKFSVAQDVKFNTPSGDSLVGYKNFHVFEHTDSLGAKIQSGVYAEFDVYFTLAGLMKLEPPFDKYFGE